MIIQFGKNPEHTITIWYDLTNWKLPFGINWRYLIDAVENKCFSFEFMFLCFGIQIEMWWWRKQK